MTVRWQTFRFDWRDEAQAFADDVAECHRLGFAGIVSWSQVQRRPRGYEVAVQFVEPGRQAKQVVPQRESQCV